MCNNSSFCVNCVESNDCRFCINCNNLWACLYCKDSSQLSQCRNLKNINKEGEVRHCNGIVDKYCRYITYEPVEYQGEGNQDGFIMNDKNNHFRIKKSTMRMKLPVIENFDDQRELPRLTVWFRDNYLRDDQGQLILQPSENHNMHLNTPELLTSYFDTAIERISDI